MTHHHIISITIILGVVRITIVPPASCSLLATAQHTSPEQVCSALYLGMRGRDGGGVRVIRGP
jgi:hypothetical protein